MTCPKCGIKLEHDDKFCWNCGADLNKKVHYEPKSIFSRVLAGVLVVLGVVALGIGIYQYSNDELRNPAQFFDSIVSYNTELSEFNINI